MLKRAIVVVRHDDTDEAETLAPAVSESCNWDIVTTTSHDLDARISEITAAFLQLDSMDESTADTLTSNWFLSFDDIAQMHVEELANLAGISIQQSNWIIWQARERD